MLAVAYGEIYCAITRYAADPCAEFFAVAQSIKPLPSRDKGILNCILCGIMIAGYRDCAFHSRALPSFNKLLECPFISEKCELDQGGVVLILIIHLFSCFVGFVDFLLKLLHLIDSSNQRKVRFIGKFF